MICLVGFIWVKKVYIMLVQQLELNWQLGAKVCEQFHLTTQTMQHAQIYISKYLSIVTFTSLQIIENKLSHAAMKFFSFRLSIIKFDVLKRHLLTLYIEHSLTIINSNLWMWIWSTIALYTLTSSSKLVGLCVLSLDYRTIPKLHSSVNFFNHELSRNNEQFLGHCTTQMREILQFFSSDHIPYYLLFVTLCIKWIEN